LVELRLRAAGAVLSSFSAEADPNSVADLGALLRSAVRRAAGESANVSDYELELVVAGVVTRTFVVVE